VEAIISSQLTYISAACRQAAENAGEIALRGRCSVEKLSRPDVFDEILNVGDTTANARAAEHRHYSRIPRPIAFGLAVNRATI
jgi:hypothetical protein